MTRRALVASDIIDCHNHFATAPAVTLNFLPEILDRDAVRLALVIDIDIHSAGDHDPEQWQQVTAKLVQADHDVPPG